MSNRNKSLKIWLKINKNLNQKFNPNHKVKKYCLQISKVNLEKISVNAKIVKKEN